MAAADLARLADTLNAALPQTQCTRCGYPDCRAYAQAMAEGAAEINQCPPGGAEAPRLLAVIDEAWCIGCTLCLKACPVDCIVGGPKAMHTVIDAQCTGCELCVPVCPVDCISLVPVTGSLTGWEAWSEPQANEARERYAFHQRRMARDERELAERLAAARPRRKPLAPKTA